jgi:hypothetical protein
MMITAEGNIKIKIMIGDSNTANMVLKIQRERFFPFVLNREMATKAI